MRAAEDIPDYVDAKVQWENTQILMQAINRIQYLENFRAMAPMIVAELKKHGVIFP